MPGVRLSFEPADIVSGVMSFGSPTPVEVAVTGPSLADDRAFAEKLRAELAQIPSLRDLQYGLSLDYPTISIEIDRERAGLSGVTAQDVARSVVASTSSSRFVVPNYWPDPKTGIGYQVQVEVPYQVMDSLEKVETVPIQKPGLDRQVLLRDVAQVRPGTMPGEYDRYNMKRTVSLTANIFGEDLGRVAGHVERAIARAGAPPKGVTVDIRGQIVPMEEILRGLAIGLGMSIVVILLLLTANFQSVRLALVVVSTTPAVVAGVVVMLWLTGTTINLQSFMGAIMAIGVAVANAILLVTFAEEHRRARVGRRGRAAVEGARGRLRPILMTSCAMIAGMVPMALGWGEGGEQTAPLGRAVIGGLAAATLATLAVLPTVFALVQGKAGRESASLDPDDPASVHYHEEEREANGSPQEPANRCRRMPLNPRICPLVSHVGSAVWTMQILGGLRCECAPTAIHRAEDDGCRGDRGGVVRSDPRGRAPSAGGVIVGACISYLTYKRYSGAVAFRNARGMATSRPRGAALLLSSATIAAAIIGLSDLAFLAGYYSYMEYAQNAERTCHWTPYREYDYVATGVSIGFVLGLCVALSTRCMVRPQPAAPEDTEGPPSGPAE